MKLLRVKMDGFGRYTAREMAFGDGLNVVYGKNEAGKSTLQQFLLAMLYGMKKPGRKRSVYLDEEAKYRPWHTGAYGGVLWMEVDGTVYRIERNLRRDDERVRIFRQDTGEELTASFPMDSRKEVSFAQSLLQADRELFVNTLCIGPIDERERVLKLRESVRHGDGGGAGGDLLSTPEQAQIRAAEEAMLKRLDVLGTERAASKPLGMALKRRDELNRAYLEAREREQSQKAARMSAEQETAEWQESVREEQELRDQVTGTLARYLRVQQARRGELLGRLELLRRALADSRADELPEIDEAAWREMQREFQRLQTSKHEYESYQKRLHMLEAESREAVAFTAKHRETTESHLVEVEHNARLLELYEEQAQKGVSPTHDPEAYEAMEANRRRHKRNLMISGALAVVTIPLCFSKWWAVGLFVAFLAYAIVSLMSSKRDVEEMEAWEEARLAEEADLEAHRREQERVEARLLELLSGFDVDTPRQYRQKWNLLLKSREQAALYQKQSQWLLGEVNRSKSEHDLLVRRLNRRLFDPSAEEEAQEAALDVTQLQVEMERWEQLVDESRQRREQAVIWEREQDGLQHELQALEKELSRWQAVATQMKVSPEPTNLFTEHGPDVQPHEMERLYMSWQAAERILFEKKSSYAEANTRYETMREGQQPAADLLLEKERAEAELLAWQEERDALLVAQEVWAEVRDELYQAIAPRFTSSLAEVTERLTQGRYGEVYLDRAEAITTISPDSGHTVELTALSEGTMDQITFALGLALSGWAIPGGERLPLLLDEPFRRYDDERLDSVYDVLLEEAKQRQIFLFTCREQEVEKLVVRHGAPVHMVELNEGDFGMLKKDKSSAGQV